MSRHFILFALLACAFACGGGSGDLAEGGIGGSGISQGPITEFGSIFVNDIEWELDGAVVEIDGVPPETVRVSDDDLTALFKLGMVVRVEGTIDTSTEPPTGEAERVYFDDEIEGPVSHAQPRDDLGEPGQFRELTVLGKKILIEEGATNFSGGPVDFDTINVGDVVEISGLVDDELGVVRATYVEQKVISDGEIKVELKGEVLTPLTETTFKLGGVTVDFDPNGLTTTLPGKGFGLGDIVEVEGMISSIDADDRITASKIELEDKFGDEDQFSTTGYVNDFNDIGDFSVGNQQVDASGAEFKNGTSSMLANGRRVEVEGKIAGGILEAKEVEFEDQEVRVHAAIALEADLAGRVPPAEEDPSLFIPSFKLLGIEIRVFPSTRIESGLLETLVVGDFLEVRGIVNAQGVITASRVELKEGINKIRLDGPVEQFDETAGQFTILGVTVFTEGAKTIVPPPPCFFEILNEGDFVEVRGFPSEIFPEVNPAKDVTLVTAEVCPPT